MSPDGLLQRFDDGCRGQADIDMRGVLWDILHDVQSSYRLAMTVAGVAVTLVDEIETTVEDYLANSYGDD